MPKSRNNRKGKKGKNDHKKRLKAYKEKQKQRQNSFRKAYLEMLQAKKEEELDKKLVEHQEAESEDIVEGLDLGLDDLGLDDIDVDDMKID